MSQAQAALNRLVQEAGVEPTLFSPNLLGGEGSREAWTYAKRVCLDSPLPPKMRTALLAASWEGPNRAAMGLHATGVPLLGQGEDIVDLSAVWSAMVRDPAQRAVLATTIRLGNGLEVPSAVQRQVRRQLGPWTQSWQDLVMFASWCDRMYSLHELDVAPLDDPRVDDWMGNVLAAEAVIRPFIPSGRRLAS